MRVTLWPCRQLNFFIDQQRPVNRYLNIKYFNYVRMAVLSFDKYPWQVDYVQHFSKVPAGYMNCVELK